VFFKVKFLTSHSKTHTNHFWHVEFLVCSPGCEKHLQLFLSCGEAGKWSNESKS